MIDDLEHRKGVLYALGAYGMWGLAPIYFKAVAEVSSMEVLAHRILWSVLFLAGLLALNNHWRSLRQLASQPRLMAALALSALVVSANWLIFIWAVAQGRILETSFGYFINPLISVFLGMIFLGERLRPGQWLAITLVGGTVGYQLILLGSLPWVALALAFSFGCYGLLRKKISVEPVLGLFIETLLLMPLAGLYLLWLNSQGQLHFVEAGIQTSLLLVAAGLVTSLPLLCFTAAAQRLSLTLMGLLQYLGPSITFGLAVFYYQEPLDGDRLLTFFMIWIALLMFSVEGWLIRRRRQQSLILS